MADAGILIQCDPVHRRIKLREEMKVQVMSEETVRDIKKVNDFTQGSIPRVITGMALPLILAQFVNVLYNIVDRIYVGRIPLDGSLALTGLGVALPIISILSAFSHLFGLGGTPLCSIARGKGDLDEASRIMGNALTTLLMASVVLMTTCWALVKPLLYLFGASEATYPYAADYLRLYLFGTPFVLITLGMNGYINSQGFATRGMMTILLGAVCNIILDPIFIYALHMGVKGAALATVISQIVSAAWALAFLTGKKAILELSLKYMRPTWRIIRRTLAMGVTGFCMNITNSLILIVANKQLLILGGDLYVGAMTIVNALRTVQMVIIQGLGEGIKPVVGYNFGANAKARVLQCIRFSTYVGIGCSLIIWLAFMLLPGPLTRLFTTDPALIAVAIPSVRIYLCGTIFLSLQFVGQNTFLGLGKAREAIFFSLLRKVILVLPLMLLLPNIGGLGVNGVFWSEPVSDLLGGAAAYLAMIFTVYRKINRELQEEHAICGGERL
jgi:putative MATE family efflux protein